MELGDADELVASHAQLAHPIARRVHERTQPLESRVVHVLVAALLVHVEAAHDVGAVVAPDGKVHATVH